MRSKDLEHPETDAVMRFELRALPSLLFEHGHLFVGVPEAIGVMRYKRTIDAP
jgi:hypothetical protein